MGGMKEKIQEFLTLALVGAELLVSSLGKIARCSLSMRLEESQNQNDMKSITMLPLWGLEHRFLRSPARGQSLN
jgi:hypothetical protein